ncbi:extracellular solute-binding protein [Paenibacillus sp. JX-17]|uniref:Extracellular solute-binding protein n=1 Tax=Paenibacillus lacisoli TaxID=3064525 RepID=A0ABT9C976_9BACL|nr:extracellular solute-binding protein [Paenibacillus sp. JX-17]MDO7905425.1 extracellular solute-binding protein [Paenibacillus sp. JX-17]
MKRKNYWLLLAILLLSLSSLSPGLEFSGGGSDVKNPEAEGVTVQTPPRHDTATGPIRIAASLNTTEYNELLRVSEHIEKQTGIQVTIDRVEEPDLYDMYNSNYELGEAADIVLVENGWIRPLAERGYLLPVETYNASEISGAGMTHIMAQMEWNGYTWAAPQDSDPYVLVGHRSRLQALGLSRLPSGLQEWKQLLSVWKKGDGAGQRAGLSLTKDMRGLLALLEFIEGESKSVQVQQLLKDKELLSLVEGLRPYIRPDHEESLEETDPSWSVAVMPLSEVMNEDKALLNNWWIRLPHHIQWGITNRSWAVSASTQHAEEAGKWIAEITASDEAVRWYERTGKLPVDAGLYRSPALADAANIVPPEGQEKGYMEPGEFPAVSFLSSPVWSERVKQLLQGQLPVQEWLNLMP